MSTAIRATLTATLLAVSAAASAQWLDYPMQGVPRTADGKVDLAAPTPRLPNGKPDLSGLWENDNPLKHLQNIAADLGAAGAPLNAAGKALLDERRANHGVDNPNNFCMPTGTVGKHAIPAPFKILQQPDLLVILYESRTIYRQIHTDGRPFPEDPQPAWHGYSVGHWDRDALVVESMGYNGKFWLDAGGHPASESLRVTERFTRPAFGKLDVEITIEDPTYYTRPWSVKQTMHFLPDTELIEHICEENNRVPEILDKGQ